MSHKDQQEKTDERILGSGNFVHQVLQETEEKSLRQIKFKQSCLTLTKIIEQECNKGNVGWKELESGSRRTMASRTRAEIARRVMKDLGLSAAEIARHLGVATSSISRAGAKTRKQATAQRK